MGRESDLYNSKNELMTKILRPVPVEKRLPEISQAGEYSNDVMIRCIDNCGDSLSLIARCNKKGEWFVESFSEFKTIEWFEEIEIESLFPDEEKAYNVANAAGNGTVYKITLHEEGQAFIKNHILRELKK